MSLGLIIAHKIYFISKFIRTCWIYYLLVKLFLYYKYIRMLPLKIRGFCWTGDLSLRFLTVNRRFLTTFQAYTWRPTPATCKVVGTVNSKLIVSYLQAAMFENPTLNRWTDGSDFLNYELELNYPEVQNRDTDFGSSREPMAKHRFDSSVHL